MRVLDIDLKTLLEMLKDCNLERVGLKGGSKGE